MVSTLINWHNLSITYQDTLRRDIGQAAIVATRRTIALEGTATIEGTDFQIKYAADMISKLVKITTANDETDQPKEEATINLPIDKIGLVRLRFGNKQHKVADQVTSSSIAIDALTNMLVQSLLFPRSGDTINSRYLVKHRQNRDGYLFLHSTNGKHATIGRTLIEYGIEPQLLYVQNMERDQFSRHLYSFGQTSVSNLWSTIENQKSPSNSPSTSPIHSRSMQARIDINSSLKALFENFFHWFRHDINKLPLPLLTSTVRSMSILSDLLNDNGLYSSIYIELKRVFDQRSNVNHPLYGYTIYTLLKCVSVVDLDRIDPYSNRSDICRSVDNFVQFGLASTSTFVIFSTLQGILYLIQSVNSDDFNNTLTFVYDFLIEELHRLNTKIDILNVSEIEPIAYHRLLFTVAFRLAEQTTPDSNFMTKFISLIKSQFIDPRLPSWQRVILSNGVQTLVIHNSIYSHMFKEASVELFGTYQLRPLHTSYAISVYLSCAYRIAQKEGPLDSHQIASFQSDIQKLLNVFSFYTTYRQRFLPPIAQLMFTLFKKEQIFEVLLSTIPIEVKSSKHFSMSDYDRSMLYLLFYVIRTMFEYQQQKIISYSMKSIFTKMPINEQSSELMVYANLVVMCALSSNPKINSLVHILLRQNNTNQSLLRSCYSQARESLKNSAEVCGFNLDVHDFPEEPVFDFKYGL